MTDWTASIGREQRMGEGLGWLAAAAAVLALHVGGGWWLTRIRQEAGMEQVFEIDLAPVMTAAAEPLDDTPPDVPMMAAPDLPLSPDEAEPLDELLPGTEVPPDAAEPDPLAEMAPDLPPQVEAPPEPLPEPPPVVEEAEVALAPVETMRPPPRPKKQAAKSPPAPRTAAPPRVEAPKAEQAAAPVAMKGTVSRQQEASWKQQVNRKVASHMLRWTNRMKAVVKVQVLIRIDGAGRVTGVSINGSTGDPGTDASLQAHAARLKSVPAPPGGQGETLRVPLTLTTRG